MAGNAVKIQINKKTGERRGVDANGNIVPLPASLGGPGETDWTPWAYAGGAGLLGYYLANSMIDNDENDKKEKSLTQKLLPWLVAAGSAAGGYALSKKAGSDDEWGEYDLNNAAGTQTGDSIPSTIDVPQPGNAFHGLGIPGDILGPALGFRAAALYRGQQGEKAQRLLAALNSHTDAKNSTQAFRDARSNYDRIDDRIRSLQSAGRRVSQDEVRAHADARHAMNEAESKMKIRRGTGVKIRKAGISDFNAAQYKIQSDPKYLDKLRARAAMKDPTGLNLGKMVSKEIPGKNVKGLGKVVRKLNTAKGSAIGAVGATSLGLLSHYLGYKQNERAKNILNDDWNLGKKKSK